MQESQKELEGELKVKLQAAAQSLSKLLNQPITFQNEKGVYDYLSAHGLVAVGIFDKSSRPTIWANPKISIPFWVEHYPVSKAAFSKIKSFDGHFTLTYSFPSSSSQKAGFVAASADRLGRLEKSFKLQIAFWVIGFLLAGLVVALLWKFIAAPFEIMEEAASEAKVSEAPSENDPASAMIEVFEKVIAELKAKEIELSFLYQESEKKALHFSTLSQHLLESLNSGIVIFDSKGKIADLNPAAKKLLEVTDFFQLPDPMEKILHQANVNHPAEGAEVEMKIGGKTKTFAVSASVISNAQKENLGKALVISDLTGFKELEKRLKENERWAFLGETAAGLAHELRNALAVMVGYTKLLTKTMGGSNSQTANQLLKETQAAEETLKRFLEYARPAGNAGREKLDLSELLREVVAALQTRFTRIRFQLTLPDKIPYWGNPDLLHQIFSNLLCNAAEASDPAGKVEVEATFLPEGKCWNISFADSGPEIPEEIKGKIFSPFFSTKAGGTGLGLAVAKKAVHLLEGEMHLEKNKVFVLKLPVKSGLRENSQVSKIDVGHNIGGT